MQPQTNDQKPEPMLIEEEAQPQGASVASQLSAWHGQRGNKSFLRAMLPSPKQHLDYGDEATKNPVKLLASLSPFAWLMFFSVGRKFATKADSLGVVRLDLRWLRLLLRQPEVGEISLERALTKAWRACPSLLGSPPSRSLSP